MGTYLKLDDIKTIEYIYPKKEVYDLSIEDNHNYFLSVNNKKILVHNSGKTLCFVRTIWNRAAIAPNSWHLILRSTHRAIKQSMFLKTFYDLQRLEPDRWGKVELWKSELTAIFPNNSRIICSGLDDNRIDSILGNEYATIYFNEVSEITFDVYETVMSRLAQTCTYEKNGEQKQLNLKCFLDCNPPKKRHWVYGLFYKGVKPDNIPIKYKDDYTKITINPIDNKENLSPQYFRILEGYTGAKKMRFVDGLYGDDKEGALFRQEWIDKNRCRWDTESNRYILPELEKEILAIDPAVSTEKNSAETGMVICGRKMINDEAHYYVLLDRTGKYTPKQWADISINLYNENKLNEIVAEKNQGGDLVERNIHAENNNVPVVLVHASKGKAMRAEPVANLCERGYIHFYGVLLDLENEITDWVPESGMKSPNRLDAFVWGITHLMESSAVIDEGFSSYDQNWYLEERKGLI